MKRGIRFLLYPFHPGVEIGLKREGFRVGAWRGRPLEKGEFFLLVSPRFFPHWEKRRWRKEPFPRENTALLAPTGVYLDESGFERYGLKGDPDADHRTLVSFAWGYIAAPKGSEVELAFREGRKRKRSGPGRIEEGFVRVLEGMWQQILPQRVESLARIPESHLPILVAAGLFPYTDLGEEGQVAIVPESVSVKSHPISEFVKGRDGETITVTTVYRRKAVRPKVFWKKASGEVVELE